MTYVYELKLYKMTLNQKSRYKNRLHNHHQTCKIYFIKIIFFIGDMLIFNL